MTARYRKVAPRTWHDERFATLTPVEKLVFLYLLTNPQSNRIGYYRLSPAQAAEDLGIALTEYAAAFDRVRGVFEWGWDPKARVILITNWWKYNEPEARNNFVGSLTDRTELPANTLDDEFFGRSRHLFIRFGLPAC